MPASTICEARSRADGVTMRLRMPDGSMLTTGVSSKIRAPAPPRQRGEAVDVFVAVDLERPRIIDAVEIAVGPELGADTIDLPALHFRLEILAEGLQPRNQLVAALDIGHLQRALAERDAGESVLRWRSPAHIRRLAATAPTARGHPRSRRARSGRRPEGRSRASRCRAGGRRRSSRHGGPRARRRWRQALPPPAPPSVRQGRRRPPRYRHRGRTSAARAPPALRHRVRPIVLAEVSLMSFSYGAIGRLSPCLAGRLVD